LKRNFLNYPFRAVYICERHDKRQVEGDEGKVRLVLRVERNRAQGERRMDKEGERNARRIQHAPKWAEIFEGLNSRLTAVARRYTKGNCYEAEDLVQDVYCRVIFYSPDPQDIENIKAYLIRTLKNLWLDEREKDYSVKMQSLDDETNTAVLNEIPSVKPTILWELENEEAKKKLLNMSRNLNPTKKEVLKLLLKGHDCDQIAVLLDMDPLLVRAHLNGIRSNVRYWLKLLKGN
jgi:RNA polymerase sigma factor (sigma-70 family)